MNPAPPRRETKHGFAAGTLDFVFLDHDKAAYLPDLERILARRWLHPGSLVVADNMRFPGAPAYRAYMTSHEGATLRTVEHPTPSNTNRSSRTWCSKASTCDNEAQAGHVT